VARSRAEAEGECGGGHSSGGKVIDGAGAPARCIYPRGAVIERRPVEVLMVASLASLSASLLPWFARLPVVPLAARYACLPNTVRVLDARLQRHAPTSTRSLPTWNVATELHDPVTLLAPQAARRSLIPAHAPRTTQAAQSSSSAGVQQARGGGWLAAAGVSMRLK
jgi:hypothetical protein